MSYNITLTNGQSLVTIADGTADTTATSLTLIGKNFAGYGQFLDENFVKILENFSNTTAPSSALQGQLWWDSTNKILKVFNGTAWKTVSSSTASATAPVTTVVGDLWWDTANGQLKVWSGSQFVVIGPAFTANQGQSGAIADVIAGTDNISHVVVKFYVNNVLTAILSKDATFTPQSAIAGFTTIKPGFNLATASPNLLYWGDANNALNLSGVPITSFLRSDQPATTAFPFTVNNNSGLTVGGAGNFTVSVGASAVNLIGNTNGFDQNLYVNVGGVQTRALGISGASGLVTVAGDPTANLGIATKQYVDAAVGTGAGSLVLRRDGGNTVTGNILPDSNNTRNLGSSGTRFNTMYATTFNGTAVQANYADLAERFEADTVYEPGTVVELGGVKEITATVEDLSENVFGVISTNAAYLMNAGAGSNATHPPVAVNGRVPVKVIGQIKKGDRLVSAGNGYARAAAKSELTPFNVIGRALEDKTDDAAGTIEAIVKLNS